jgi:hypothetical protein
VFPSFDGFSAVARVERLPSHSLDAIYFDTPKHDLAVHRVTLRRRTGGPDAGWHLKLPAGPDSRTEVHAPLDADSPEQPLEQLVDIVLAIVRDRPLAPVARITTTRSVVMLHGADGAGLAEFCDDEVRAWAIADGGHQDEQQWHEWELELVDGTVEGGAALLDRLGVATRRRGRRPGTGRSWPRCSTRRWPRRPIRPEPPADPVHRAVAEQVAELLEWDRAVRADVYDSVHQMRVTTRKIRSLLQASEDAFGLTDDAWVLDELRQLASVLGIAGTRRCWPSATRARWTPCPPSWCAARCGSGWSRGATAATRPACAGPWPRCALRRISGCSTPWRAGVRAAPGHHPGAEPRR